VRKINHELFQISENCAVSLSRTFTCGPNCSVFILFYFIQIWRSIYSSYYFGNLL